MVSHQHGMCGGQMNLPRDIGSEAVSEFQLVEFIAPQDEIGGQRFFLQKDVKMRNFGVVRDNQLIQRYLVVF